MMKTKITFIAAAALMMAACSRMENPFETHVPVTLSYSTVAVTETKAAQNLNEGTFDTGETVKVRISNAGAGEWTDYNFTTGESGAMSPYGAVPYYPAGAQNIDIVAWYPATAGTSFSVQTDQTTDASYKASDLMFASVTNQAKQTGAVNLAFSHKMAKINVNITAGQGIGSITGLSLLNVKPTVALDLATGAVGEAGGEATAIAMSNNGSAVIPAQTISGGLLSIVTDKGTATYTVTGKEFAAGQRYTINITVNLGVLGTTSAITDWITGWTEDESVFFTPPNIAGHEFVDMGTVTIGGVEKNLKWATCNVGADNPWDYGDYYAWGETETYYEAGTAQNTPPTWKSGKSEGYDWPSYKWCNGTSRIVTKYCTESTYWDWWGSSDPMDNKTVLDPEDDAAHVKWGVTWRIPTEEEWTALLDDTLYDWVWTNDYLNDGSNHKGRIVTRKNVGGNDPCAGRSIFLPAAGGRGGTDLDGVGSWGGCWSSSLHTDNPSLAWIVFFDSDRHERNIGSRTYGHSVRPVTE